MLEYQENPHKRIWLKIIASVIVMTFLWYDIAWAGDLFYSYAPASPTASSPLPSNINDDKLKEVSEEVTNYDVLQYNRKPSGAEGLLHDAKEQEQSYKFSPTYVQEQQSKHEEIIRQKQSTEDLLWNLRNKVQQQEQLDVDLKKKRSSEGPSGNAGMGMDYTLTDPDDILDPHNLNDYEFNAEQALDKIDKFDVTRRPDINLDTWKQGAEEKTDDNGIKYWAGYTDKDNPAESRHIESIIYFGDKDNRIIQSIFTGYRLNPGTGQYEAKYRIDYTYAGKDITETKKYDISSGADVLIEKSTYAGTDKDNKVQETQYFKASDPLTPYMRVTYNYDADNKLTSSITYSKTALGVEYQASKTSYKGDKGKEIADYTQNFEEDGTTVSTTTVYYYKGDKRAQDTYYRDPKEKAVTYWGDIDTDKDGQISDAEIAVARKRTETFL